MKSFKQNLRKFMVACAALAVLPATQALSVTLTNSDAIGASSFNSAGKWDSGAAPSSGSDYVTGGFLLRTPGVANGVFAFGGDSLTVTGSGLAGAANNEALIFKGTGAAGLISRS